MNPEIKKAWIAALRGDEYRRGEGGLCKTSDEGRGDSFCCLGVLCDLAVKAGLGEWCDEGLFRAWKSEDWGSSEAGILPKPVADWAGLDEPNPVVGSASLAQWNDSRHAPFSLIAELVESHL